MIVTQLNKFISFSVLFLMLSFSAFSKENYYIETSNTVIDCNGGVFNDGKVTYIYIRSKKTTTGWIKTENVTIKNCTIKGGIRILGMGNNGQAADVKASSLSLGHTERVQAAAPTNITLSNVVIETQEGLTLLYIAPGTTYVKVENCVFQGVNTGSGPIVYLDAESAHNTFRNNTFKATSTREVIACDGSAYNLIEGNRFEKITKGGIYLYRNCGEGGSVRHQTPHHNIIRNNIFDLKDLYLKKVLGYYTETNYGVWLGSRNGNRNYCDDDIGYSFGSSIDNRDFADNNTVVNNTFLNKDSEWFIKNSGSNNEINYDPATSLINVDKLPDKISLFPNPAQDYIVCSGLTEKAQMQIFNLSGRALKNMEVLPHQTVDVSTLPSGVYIVRVADQFIKLVRH